MIPFGNALNLCASFGFFMVFLSDISRGHKSSEVASHQGLAIMFLLIGLSVRW